MFQTVRRTKKRKMEIEGGKEGRTFFADVSTNHPYSSPWNQAFSRHLPPGIIPGTDFC
jgi:hypothetical protein